LALFGPEYNQGASWLQVNPSKSKENGLDSFRFLWRNWVFSTTYSEKNKKISRPPNSPVRLRMRSKTGAASFT